MRFLEFIKENRLLKQTVLRAKDSAGGSFGFDMTFTGKKVGINPKGSTIYAGTAVSNWTNTKLPGNVIWVVRNSDSVLIAYQLERDAAVHKKAIEYAKTAERFWDSDKREESFYLMHQHKAVVKAE